VFRCLCVREDWCVDRQLVEKATAACGDVFLRGRSWVTSRLVCLEGDGVACRGGNRLGRRWDKFASPMLLFQTRKLRCRVDLIGDWRCRSCRPG
jgi:hypothetical protein